MNNTARTIPVISLYRLLMKEANKFTNYNFKYHALRKVKYTFHKNKSIPNEMIEEKYQFGKSQLESLKRQTRLTQLYREDISVMQSTDLMNSSLYDTSSS